MKNAFYVLNVRKSAMLSIDDFYLTAEDQVIL